MVPRSYSFITDGRSLRRNPHFPPFVAFSEMQENIAVQFRHHETAGEAPLVAINAMQENTQAIFLIHPEYHRGALTSERMHEKRFGSYQIE